MRVLNVGGGSRVLPAEYEGWDQVLLDIDPAVLPDICCDALEIGGMSSDEYDAIYCSHGIEHFYRHDIPRLLSGFLHVLKDGGFIDLAVPNLRFLLQEMSRNNFDIDDVWYRLEGGAPVRFHDVLYGWSIQMESSGNLYYAHHSGYTPTALYGVLISAGFQKIQISESGANLFARGYKCQ